MTRYVQKLEKMYAEQKILSTCPSHSIQSLKNKPKILKLKKKNQQIAYVTKFHEFIKKMMIINCILAFERANCGLLFSHFETFLKYHSMRYILLYLKQKIHHNSIPYASMYQNRSIQLGMSVIFRISKNISKWLH